MENGKVLANELHDVEKAQKKINNDSGAGASHNSNEDNKNDKYPLIRCDQIQDCNVALFLSTRFSDVEFDVENVIIPAHRLILATRSSVFEAMLYGDFVEKENQAIPITDISASAFREMLRYMYSNNLLITNDNCIELLYASHKYDLSHLENRCKSYIQQNTNETNVCSFYDALSKFDAFNDITKALLAYIDTKWTIETAIDFDGISVDGLKSIVNYLSSQDGSRAFKKDKFEVDLFQRVIEWAKNNCEENGLQADPINIRKALKGCEQLISFTKMNAAEFYFAVNFCPDFFSMEEIGSIFTKLKHPSIGLTSKADRRIISISRSKASEKFSNTISSKASIFGTPTTGSPTIRESINPPPFIFAKSDI